MGRKALTKKQKVLAAKLKLLSNKSKMLAVKPLRNPFRWVANSDGLQFGPMLDPLRFPIIEIHDLGLHFGLQFGPMLDPLWFPINMEGHVFSIVGNFSKQDPRSWISIVLHRSWISNREAERRLT